MSANARVSRARPTVMLRSRFQRSYDARVPATGDPLLERERELEEFERLRAAARRGEGAAAIVEGPAGIGKTRLLAAAGEGAEGLEVRRARASELERDFPFGVVRQLFEPVFFAAGEEQRSRLLAGAGGLAERVLSGSAVPDSGGSGDPFAVLHGFCPGVAVAHRNRDSAAAWSMTSSQQRRSCEIWSVSRDSLGGLLIASPSC
jgi:hypothetical protein